MRLVAEAGGGFSNVQLEQAAGVAQGLVIDVTAERDGVEHAIEFHHKADRETDSNPVAIYALTKLKEYAINYGLAGP